MGKTTTKEMGRGKVEQKYVNHIEQGLSLPGGIMIKELAANLALKFGGWYAAMNAAADLDIYTKVKISEGEIVGKEIIKEKITKAREARRKAEELQRTENHNYLKIVLAYIAESYGEERREIIGEPNSRLVGYGDRIEIDKNRHLHKLW